MPKSSEYLSNPYCTFTPLSDFSGQKRLIVTSLFRMSTGGYKPFTMYTDGLRRVSKLCVDEGLHLVVFVDHSVLRDAGLMRALRALRSTSLVRYSCDAFMLDGYHIGVFGTLVRFFPLFDLPGNRAEAVFTIDADATDEAVSFFKESLLKVAEYLEEAGLADAPRLAYYGNYNHVNAEIVEDTMRTRDASPIVLPYCVADSLIALKKKAPKEPLFAFMDELKPYMGSRPPRLLMSDYIRNNNNNKTLRKKCVNNFCFGVDEYFIARRLIPRLVADGVTFAFGYRYDLNSHLYYHLPANVQSKMKPNYARVLSGYLREMGYDRAGKDVEAGVKLSLTALEDEKKKKKGSSAKSRSTSKMSLVDLDHLLYVLPKKTGRASAGLQRFAERFMALLLRLEAAGDHRVFRRRSPVREEGAFENFSYFGIRLIEGGKAARPLIKRDNLQYLRPIDISGESKKP